MKARLLKRLRKQYELQERNGKFRVFDNVECLGGIYNQTNWTTFEEAVENRRKWILKVIDNYDKPPKKLAQFNN
jgi:hypothetical protein